MRCAAFIPGRQMLVADVVLLDVFAQKTVVEMSRGIQPTGSLEEREIRRCTSQESVPERSGSASI